MIQILIAHVGFLKRFVAGDCSMTAGEVVGTVPVAVIIAQQMETVVVNVVSLTNVIPLVAENVIPILTVLPRSIAVSTDT